MRGSFVSRLSQAGKDTFIVYDRGHPVRENLPLFAGRQARCAVARLRL